MKYLDIIISKARGTEKGKEKYTETKAPMKDERKKKSREVISEINE